MYGVPIQFRFDGFFLPFVQEGLPVRWYTYFGGLSSTRFTRRRMVFHSFYAFVLVRQTEDVAQLIKKIF